MKDITTKEYTMKQLKRRIRKLLKRIRLLRAKIRLEREMSSYLKLPYT
jgi:hypothetical protein